MHVPSQELRHRTFGNLSLQSHVSHKPVSATACLLSCISPWLLITLRPSPYQLYIFLLLISVALSPRRALWQDHRHRFISHTGHSGEAIPFVLSCALSFYFLFSLSLYAFSVPPAKASTAVPLLVEVLSVLCDPHALFILAQ